jgi:hypothetical protein
MGDERPDQDRQSSGRLKSNRQFPSLMHARPDHNCQTSGRLIWIAILTLRRHASGRDTTSSGRLIDLPFLGTWKKIKNWSSTGRRPDGCKLAQKLLDTVWGLDGMNTSSGRMMLVCLSVRTGWHVVQTDGTVDRWASGRDGSIIRTADRELEFLLTCRLWIVESLFTASLHLSDFVQTQNEAKILTGTSFLYWLFASRFSE